MKSNRGLIQILTAALSFVLLIGGCRQGAENNASPMPSEPSAVTALPSETPAASAAPAETAGVVSAPLSEAEKGDIVILFTSDIHCGLEQGFGVEGLLQIRKTMEKQGISTLLVDNGDAID